MPPAMRRTTLVADALTVAAAFLGGTYLLGVWILAELVYAANGRQLLTTVQWANVLAWPWRVIRGG